MWHLGAFKMTSLSKGRAFGKYDADDRGRGCRAKDDVTLQKYDFWEKNSKQFDFKEFVLL